MAAKTWVFTINNPSSDHLEFTSEMKYLVYQKEVGETGTPHLQGYVELKARKRLNGVRQLFPGAHVERRRGTQSEAREYCMKPEGRIAGPFEFGEFKLTIEDKLKNVVGDMRITGKRPRSYIEDFPESISRGYSTLEMFYADLRKSDAMGTWNFNLQNWTEQVETLLLTEDHRRVIWCYGPLGGEGKTCYAKHLIKTREAFYTVGGRTQDVARLYNYSPIVIYDIPRSEEQYVNYELIEQMKNGIVQSGKYEPVVKYMRYVEVIVMANFLPREGALSGDRIKLIKC